MQIQTNPDVLPEGWSESSPGGLAACNHPVFGGIIDKVMLGESWFVIFNHAELKPIDDLPSRADAFAAFNKAIENVKP